MCQLTTTDLASDSAFGQQCCVRLHAAESLTGFNNTQNLQQSVQRDATCNIQQCCVRLRGVFTIRKSIKVRAKYMNSQCDKTLRT